MNSPAPRSVAAISLLSLASLTALTACHSAGTAPITQDAPAAAASAPPAAATTSAAKPTIVLVHGAFADASSWNGVVELLQARGYPVVAPANPLRGLEADAASLASVLKTIDGPMVVAGHSYGGMVISRAALGNAAVKALVYVAAFAPDTGESAGAILHKFPGAKFGPDAARVVPYALPCNAGTGADTYIKSEVFRDDFAADLPANVAARMAATQRPLEGAAIGASFTGTPAWKSIPSWALVAKADNMIAPAAERFMAERAHAHVVEVDASHAVAVSHPDAVADLIVSAASTVH